MKYTVKRTEEVEHKFDNYVDYLLFIEHEKAQKEFEAIDKDDMGVVEYYYEARDKVIQLEKAIKAWEEARKNPFSK